MRQQIYRKCPSIRNHKPFTYEHKLKQRWSNYEAIVIMQYPYQKHLHRNSQTIMVIWGQMQTGDSTINQASW